MSTKLWRAKEVGELVKAALAAGWQVVSTRGSHLKFTAPSGAIVFAGRNKSDWRAIHNIKARLRREGLEV
jgi:predicted RNA binding protein YcfA (HicA-like mRNA interferase family)